MAGKFDAYRDKALGLLNEVRQTTAATDSPDGGRFEVYQDKAGKFRWRLKAVNGEVVASGEAYESKSGAIEGTAAVQRAAAGASVEDLTD